MASKLLPYGPNAWLIRHPDHQLLVSLTEALVRTPPLDFIEPVLGFDTLLLHYSAPVSETDVRHSIRELNLTDRSSGEAKHHDIPVIYDGPDLLEIAESLRLRVEKIIQLHTAPVYTVRFLGFAPGFAYLDGLDTHLHLPRRDSPRTRIEPGSVAIGGTQASIYTVPSPGGWNILGHTEHPLFSPQKNDLTAFTLNAGDTLKFHPIEAE